MYEVIESKRWKHADGRTASLYGAVPYLNDSDREAWTLETVGFTVRNNKTEAVGIGRAPWKTQAEAQTWVNTQEKK